ncbi:expressed unknown protein [Seminavis robusta]|uniref:Uncharacterized protein n=1 Tax=Seminavis robusta TaxID=568900 RepID=A0A9N8HX02_9STRA|nr:expressed unknown protein [Seminavis robusta]|eukprot:Sro2094_g314150.1 n/a (149) ;mRNA; f:8229-8675
MEQIYREMPASINEEGDGSSSKPWQVDLARKTYTHSRRFRRTKRVQPPPPPLAPPTPASPPPPVATISFQKETPTMMEKASPGLHVPRTSGRCDGDDEYPSDEECGFGGGCVSRSSSSPSSSYMGDESPTGMQGSRPARSYLYFYRPS